MSRLLSVFLYALGIFSFSGIAFAQYPEIPPLRDKQTIEKEKVLLPPTPLRQSVC
jgi:hypothetical protein